MVSLNDAAQSKIPTLEEDRDSMLKVVKRSPELESVMQVPLKEANAKIDQLAKVQKDRVMWSDHLLNKITDQLDEACATIRQDL